MNDLTRVLNSLSTGDESEAAVLFQEIYNELRGMAAAKMAAERPGHTLQATALVHEAYLRLVGHDGGWDNRRHFFGAASEAMRRILVENARRRRAAKRGGGIDATVLDEEVDAGTGTADDKIIQVHEALDALEAEDPLKARIVKLRFFVGLGHDEIAALLGVNEKTVRRHWELARIRLYRTIRDAG